MRVRNRAKELEKDIEEFKTTGVIISEAARVSTPAPRHLPLRLPRQLPLRCRLLHAAPVQLPRRVPRLPVFPRSPSAAATTTGAAAGQPARGRGEILIFGVPLRLARIVELAHLRVGPYYNLLLVIRQRDHATRAKNRQRPHFPSA